jgi:cytochrome c biogenesis protein CcdA
VTDTPRYIKKYFVIVSIIAFILGLVLYFTPSTLLNLFMDTPMSNKNLYFPRFIGTTLFAFGYLNYWASSQNLTIIRNVAIVNIMSLLPATLLSFSAYFFPMIDRNRWLLCLEHTLILLGFTATMYLLKQD